MSLINFNEIDFNKSINKENKIINFNGSEISIINYISTYDTYDLIAATLQKAFEDNIYNPVKLETYFNLHLIYIYTNIVFSTEDRSDEVFLYDTLKRSGLIKTVKEAIGEKEINRLYELLIETMNRFISYQNSFGGATQTILENFNDKLKNWLEILNNISPDWKDQVKNSIKNLSQSKE